MKQQEWLATGSARRTHGMAHTKEYTAWKHMKDRCNNKSHPSYPNYGGRGIKVCDRWLEEDGMKNFYEDMGRRPEGLTLERGDNNGNYEPSNCFWATWEEQRSNSRQNHYLEFNGKIQTIARWAKEMGIKRSTLRARIQRGWSTKKALMTPTNSWQLLEFSGKIQAIGQWAREIGVKPDTLYWRIMKGWSTNKALTTPTRSRSLTPTK